MHIGNMIEYKCISTTLRHCKPSANYCGNITLGDVSGPLYLRGADAHLSGMFFDPLVALVEHALQAVLAFLQLLLQRHAHVLLDVA